MSNPIADAIRAAAAGGKLSLTLFPTSDGTYQASISIDRKGWWVQMDRDPCEAIRKALRVTPEGSATPDEDVFG
jgi:hypothetical protein